MVVGGIGKYIMIAEGANAVDSALAMITYPKIVGFEQAHMTKSRPGE